MRSIHEAPFAQGSRLIADREMHAINNDYKSESVYRAN